MDLDIAQTREKLAYSVEEVSEATTLSKSYVRNEIAAGNLKVKRFGRRVLILNRDLKNYLNEKEGEK